MSARTEVDIDDLWRRINALGEAFDKVLATGKQEGWQGCGNG